MSGNVKFRDPQLAKAIADKIKAIAPKMGTVKFCHVCGTHEWTITHFGLRSLLPGNVEVIAGPGCPVCIVPAAEIDEAVQLARKGVVVTCFGDVLRVPGSESSLLEAKANGADVRVVYGVSDAVEMAEREPEKEFSFFAVGFETTAPANAMAVQLAAKKRLANFSLLVAQVRVPPALEAILDAPECRVQAFLAAGHVCTVMGTAEYEPLSRRYGVPVVVTGFEPLDLLQGVAMAVRQLEEGRADVEIQYARVVRPEGNRVARGAVEEVFEVVDREWRGLGPIARSGFRLRERYAAFDAERRFADDTRASREDPECQAGLVLQGRKRPQECPAFGGRCTPEHPLGAPMVSSEGACAAYYLYRRRLAPAGAAGAA
jgi:hydrogenase expression/formation protein HypD